LAQQRPVEAEQPLRRAIELFPHDARYWHNLCLSLRGQSRLADAEVAARNALALLDSYEHWASLGNCLYELQQWEPARQAFEQAVARNPNDADTWRNLGGAEQALGRLDRAQYALERSLNLAPANVPSQLRYAMLHVQRGNIEEGVQFAKAILGQMPDLVQAWLLLGNAERLRDNLPAAEAAYRQAVSRFPRDHDSRFNLGLVLLQRAQFCEAEAWMRQLVAENAHDPDAWTVLGASLHAQARMGEAIDAMRRAVTLRPQHSAHSKLLVALHYDAAHTPEQILAEHRAWAATYAQPFAPATPPVARPLSAGRKLRIGFIAMDFSGGPSGFLGLRGLECLDKSQCSVVCYSDRVTEDEYTERFRAAADLWHVSMGLSDEELIKQVRRDEIDVLIDMGGHVGRRLMVFARRPAPYQATWLGYTGTTGMETMDGLIADRFHVRPGEESWYAETVLRMPHDYICYGAPTGVAPVEPLPALSSGCVTFGCFNNPAKYSPLILDVWSSILRRVPRSRLLLKYGGLNQPDAQRWLLGEFSRRGIAAERIVLEGWSFNREVMQRYGAVDLALDTQPYSGGLTTCEALWMGVPVVCCPGRGFATRHSTSHMTNAGYGQFVAADIESYVDLAVQWAGRLEDLAALRAGMREQVANSPLCDGAGYAKDFLQMLQTAFETKARSAEHGARSIVKADH
jgi:protein O-GlcNAc transferase